MQQEKRDGDFTTFYVTEVIAVDEIAINDCESLKEIFHCGIRVLGTIHAGSIKEVMEKEWDKRKLAFERYILIVRDLEGRRNISVYNHEFEMLRGIVMLFRV